MYVPAATHVAACRAGGSHIAVEARQDYDTVEHLTECQRRLQCPPLFGVVRLQ